MEDIFSSWYSNHNFDIEKLRDTRLRAHFKERYDFRKNMCDWDFGMNLEKCAPMISKKEYIAWRLTGVAFETRLAKNTIPNRTFSSYVPGKDVSNSLLSFGNAWLTSHNVLYRKKQKTIFQSEGSGET